MTLKHCFLHLKGITEEIELELINNDIYSWDDLINSISNQMLNKDIQLISNNTFYDNLSTNDINYNSNNQLNDISTLLKYPQRVLSQIYESQEAHESKNWTYFTSKLLSKYHYKLLPLTTSIAYVDIETTGLSKENHYITTLGIYDGNSSHIYTRGVDLEEAFEELDNYDVIVTFNGKQFDMPFIEHESHKTYECIHLDLRFMLKELGLSGGLKRIEQELGLQRDEEVAQIDGFFAVELWKRFQRGDLYAFELLKKYNIEDIENLEVLLNWYLSQKNLLN